MDPWDCKGFLTQRGFPSSDVPFKGGFIIFFLISEVRAGFEFLRSRVALQKMFEAWISVMNTHLSTDNKRVRHIY